MLGTQDSPCHVLVPAGDLTFPQESRNLFCCLYRSWCHNPVTTVSLCFLTQNYKHAYDLIQKLYPLGIFCEADTCPDPWSLCGHQGHPMGQPSLLPAAPSLPGRCPHDARAGQPAPGTRQLPSHLLWFLWCKKRKACAGRALTFLCPGGEAPQHPLPLRKTKALASWLDEELAAPGAVWFPVSSSSACSTVMM